MNKPNTSWKDNGKVVPRNKIPSLPEKYNTAKDYKFSIVENLIIGEGIVLSTYPS